jgi:uncharacterized membrane protein
MSENKIIFKDKLPKEVFETFRISLIIKTWNETPSDEEVERYIYALVNTSDSHPHDWKPMSSTPTFKPAT